jgi:hypothetical protein
MRTRSTICVGFFCLLYLHRNFYFLCTKSCELTQYYCKTYKSSIFLCEGSIVGISLNRAPECFVPLHFFALKPFRNCPSAWTRLVCATTAKGGWALQVSVSGDGPAGPLHPQYGPEHIQAGVPTAVTGDVQAWYTWPALAGSSFPAKIVLVLPPSSRQRATQAAGTLDARHTTVDPATSLPCFPPYHRTCRSHTSSATSSPRSSHGH